MAKHPPGPESSVLHSICCISHRNLAGWVLGSTKSNLGISFYELVIIWFSFPVQNQGPTTQALKYIVTVVFFFCYSEWLKCVGVVRGLDSDRHLVNINRKYSCKGDIVRSIRPEAAGDKDGT